MKIGLHDILFFKTKQSSLAQATIKNQSEEEFDQFMNIKSMSVYFIGDFIDLDKMLGLRKQKKQHIQKQQISKLGGKVIYSKLDIYSRTIYVQIIYSSKDINMQKFSKSIINYQSKISRIKTTILVINMKLHTIQEMITKIKQYQQIWDNHPQNKNKMVIVLFNDTAHYKDSHTAVLSSVFKVCHELNLVILQLGANNAYQIANSIIAPQRSNILISQIDSGHPSSHNPQTNINISKLFANPSNLFQLFYRIYIIKCTQFSRQLQFKQQTQNLEKFISQLQTKIFNLQYSIVYKIFMNWKEKKSGVILNINQIIKCLKSGLDNIGKIGNRKDMKNKLQEVRQQLKQNRIIQQFAKFRATGRHSPNVIVKGNNKPFDNKNQAINSQDDQQYSGLSNYVMQASKQQQEQMRKLEVTQKRLIKQYQVQYNKVYKSEEEKIYQDHYKNLQAKRVVLSQEIKQLQKLFQMFDSNFNPNMVQNHHSTNNSTSNDHQTEQNDAINNGKTLGKKTMIIQQVVYENDNQLSNSNSQDNFQKQLKTEIQKKQRIKLKTVQQFRSIIQNSVSLFKTYYQQSVKFYCQCSQPCHCQFGKSKSQSTLNSPNPDVKQADNVIEYDQVKPLNIMIEYYLKTKFEQLNAKNRINSDNKGSERTNSNNNINANDRNRSHHNIGSNEQSTHKSDKNIQISGTKDSKKRKPSSQILVKQKDSTQKSSISQILTQLNNKQPSQDQPIPIFKSSEDDDPNRKESVDKNTKDQSQIKMNRKVSSTDSIFDSKIQNYRESNMYNYNELNSLQNRKFTEYEEDQEQRSQEIFNKINWNIKNIQQSISHYNSDPIEQRIYNLEYLQYQLKSFQNYQKLLKSNWALQSNTNSQPKDKDKDNVDKQKGGKNNI